MNTPVAYNYYTCYYLSTSKAPFGEVHAYFPDIRPIFPSISIFSLISFFGKEYYYISITFNNLTFMLVIYCVHVAFACLPSYKSQRHNPACDNFANSDDRHMPFFRRTRVEFLALLLHTLHLGSYYLQLSGFCRKSENT